MQICSALQLRVRGVLQGHAQAGRAFQGPLRGLQTRSRAERSVKINDRSLTAAFVPRSFIARKIVSRDNTCFFQLGSREPALQTDLRPGLWATLQGPLRIPDGILAAFAKAARKPPLPSAGTQIRQRSVSLEIALEAGVCPAFWIARNKRSAGTAAVGGSGKECEGRFSASI